MRFAVSVLLLFYLAGLSSAQESKGILNLDDGIKVLEERAVGKKVSVNDTALIDVLKQIVNQADNILAGGAILPPPTGMPSAGSFQLVSVPRTVQKSGRGLFRRTQLVTVCERMCVWVPDDSSYGGCSGTQRAKSELSVLRRNAIQLSERLNGKIASDAELDAIVRQVYSLAVMSRDPFVPGKTRE